MTSLLLETSVTNTDIITTLNSSAYNVDMTSAFQLQSAVTVNTYTAAVYASATDIDNTTERFTKTAHGFPTGLKGQFTTSSALPTGLSTSTDYFVIKIDANTVQFATSLVNAQAGTAINITTDGTGNQTFTPTALAGATVKLQYSISDASLAAGVWTDVAAATSISTTANIGIAASTVAYKYIRYSYTLTAGGLTCVNYLRAVNANYLES